MSPLDKQSNERPVNHKARLALLAALTGSALACGQGIGTSGCIDNPLTPNNDCDGTGGDENPTTGEGADDESGAVTPCIEYAPIWLTQAACDLSPMMGPLEAREEALSVPEHGPFALVDEPAPYSWTVVNSPSTVDETYIHAVTEPSLLFDFETGTIGDIVFVNGFQIPEAPSADDTYTIAAGLYCSSGMKSEYTLSFTRPDGTDVPVLDDQEVTVSTGLEAPYPHNRRILHAHIQDVMPGEVIEGRWQLGNASCGPVTLIENGTELGVTPENELTFLRGDNPSSNVNSPEKVHLAGAVISPQ